MDDRLRELMQELGNAINESLADSERIAAAIADIKANGYDVFLLLEATIGFNKRSEEEGDDGEEEGWSNTPPEKLEKPLLNLEGPHEGPLDQEGSKVSQGP